MAERSGCIALQQAFFCETDQVIWSGDACPICAATNHSLSLASVLDRGQIPREQLIAALRLAQPILDEELQCRCWSFCPPCKEGDTYDYSQLSEQERGYIEPLEAALDAVDAALAEAEPQKEKSDGNKNGH